VSAADAGARPAAAPEISICIPTRNGARFLPDALGSALSQVTPRVEIVVVDNCSDDETQAVVADLRARGAYFRFHRNDRDLGLVGNFNRCLAHARGEYVTILCVDDILLPEFISEMAARLDDHPEAVMSACARRLVDDAGRPLATRRYSRTSQLVPGRQVIRRCLAGGNYIGEPSAVMFRKARASRGFSALYPHLTDLEMWLHLLEQGDLATLARPLCAIRQHSGQLTKANIRSGALVEDNIRLQEQYRHKPYVRWTWRDDLRYRGLMVWRVWMAGAALPREQREAILARHASRWAYRLMPVLSAVLGLARGARRLLCSGARKVNDAGRR
jgi:glycosyltransferase involved in cell wall biosynthesis